MLIEINLLPQREVKNKSLLLLTIISATILLIGGFFAYFLNRTFEYKLASLEQQISTTEQLVEAEQEKIISYEATDSLSELERTVQWAQSYPIKAVQVLQSLTALLPERGFIQTFTYEETGKVLFEVQFETSREAAYYLNALHESDWVSTAKLNSLDADTEFYDKKFGEADDGPEEGKLSNEKYIPRYLGQYEVELNREFFKESNSSTTEGGVGI